MFELLVDFFILLLMKYPGALIRWIVLRNKSYKELLNQDFYLNAIPVILLLLIIFMVFYLN